MTNSLKTIMLMALMIGLLLFLGEWLGGEQGLVMAFIFSMLMNFGMYWFSSKIVLMTYGAREVQSYWKTNTFQSSSTWKI